MRTVALIVGTRPEAIKLAPVYFALRDSAQLRPVLVATAQHRQMLDQALGAFGLQADHDLDLMRAGQTLPELTGRVVTAVCGWLDRHHPDVVLVQGDTTTVLGSALAAFYSGIPVGHVEAGLRTGSLRTPFPEEMNRRVTSTLTRWHFCPTEGARANLLREGVESAHCHVTGNTVVDALLGARERARLAPAELPAFAARLGLPAAFAARHLIPGGAPWALMTGHRRESFGEGFERICQAIRRLTEEHPDLGVIYPVHLNPQVQEPVRRLLQDHPRVVLIPPTDYLDFIRLLDRATFVLTDSGGVQEEAPTLGKPVLVLRDSTERPEGVAAGTCVLVGTDPARIVAEAARLLRDPAEYARRAALRNPYGDGQTAGRIRAILEREPL